MDKCFTGSVSRIAGTNFKILAQEVRSLHLSILFTADYLCLLPTRFLLNSIWNIYWHFQALDRHRLAFSERECDNVLINNKVNSEIFYLKFCARRRSKPNILSHSKFFVNHSRMRHPHQSARRRSKPNVLCHCKFLVGYTRICPLILVLFKV